MNIKKLVLGVAASTIVFGAMAVTVYAAPGNDGTPPPGQEQAGDVGAQCGTGAASGAFGYYAHAGIPNLIPDPPRGADGIQTGLNNSAVCGNRQGNLP